jgi:hypothetical protein
MLQHARLLGNLREFCDAGYTAFHGYPSSRTSARRAWAHAFADYFERVEEAIARPPPPPDSHPSLVLTEVEGSFFADLGLDESISAPASAADFAGAWRAAVEAVTPGPGATDSTLSSYVFVQFSNVVTLRATLETRLLALFSAPSGSLATRLSEIAQAFHDASTALRAGVTITPSSGTPAPGVMSVR